MEVTESLEPARQGLRASHILNISSQLPMQGGCSYLRHREPTMCLLVSFTLSFIQVEDLKSFEVI